MDDNPTDDVIRNIITRYECEEEEFLRELEGIQGQIPERTSVCEDVPVLGALCSLVGEISKLRRENKALRYQLNVAVEPKRSVVHRVSAILEGRSNIIPKIMGRRAFHQCEIRNGARERLSTPPHKANISSDVSDPLRTTLTPTRQIPAPPIVLPEMSDSDVEHSIFTEVALPNYGNGNNEVRGSRAIMSRSKVSSVSERTSPSSASSRDHSENMTTSRSGFFEIIGLKKKKEKSIESKKETITCKVILKKRKRKISESSSVHSSENNTRSDKWSLSSTASKNSLTTANKSAFDESNGNKQSLLQAPKQYHIQRQHKEQENKKCSHDKNSTTVSEESDDDYHERSSGTPKSIFCPGFNGSRSTAQRNRFSNRGISDNQAIHDENETIRNELVMTRNRNNRLIEQLREKSMEQSKLRTQMSTLQKQIGILRNRCRLNEALEKLSMNDRVITRATAAIDNVEEKLKNFDDKVQAMKAEMMKNGQAIINQSFREQNAYQSCLEHIERLQRDNFSMLQDKGSNIGSHDQRICQLLEIMPSYDALYSFTISIVRKLGQLRASYIEKNIYANRSDFEVMHAQSSLLIIHAQLERLKLQLYEATKRRSTRPASYHGEDLLQKIVHQFNLISTSNINFNVTSEAFVARAINPQMNFLLPFKLHGGRIRKHRRSDSCAMESEIEKNEQSIENEFLRLFDYARCLSRISEFTGINKASLERAGISNLGSHIRNDLQNTTIIPQQEIKSAPIRHREQQRRNSTNKIYISQRNYKSQPAGRPISLVETEGRTLTAGNIPYFGDSIVKKIENSVGKSSPLLNLHPLINYNHTRSIVSSLQDVRNNMIRSPASTPIMKRRMNLNEQPRTINQGSLDSFGGNELPKYDTPLSHSSGGSSDYAVISAKQLYMEKRSMISKRPSAINPSKLPHLRKNANQTNSPPLLSDSDRCQLRRNPETVGMIREKNAGSTVSKNFEKSRLPKISSILTEKKKCTSWLSRIKATK
uniref:Nck-associated protein 5 n=1 Tax=Loa loa TaxID=7209 RepID=A0A1I7VBA7_LOALO